MIVVTCCISACAGILRRLIEAWSVHWDGRDCSGW